MKMKIPDFGPLPPGVSANDMLTKDYKGKDHPVTLEHERRRKLLKDKINDGEMSKYQERVKNGTEHQGIDAGFSSGRPVNGGTFKGINSGGLRDIGMIPAAKPINTAGPIKYNPMERTGSALIYNNITGPSI